MATSSYAWVISRNIIDGPAGELASGPRNAANGDIARLRAGEGLAFRLRDGDGELYFEGRYLGDQSEDLFGPLDDYGMPGYGCTAIEYQGADGGWESI